MLAILATASLLLQLSLSISTLSITGSKFFTSDGAQWYIKGVAYQLTDDDPLANGTQCALDAALMQTLGTNAIRVYHVDASADHDACMQTFSDAGIYTFIDLDTFDTYILGDAPTWNETQYKAFQAVMDTFASYDNVAGFFVGNEVLTMGSESPAAPYVKAAAADMKAYRDSKDYRDIPVGYSAADIAELRPNLQNYMACGGNASENLDFFSLNAYEWCGDATFQTSGYEELQQNATGYPIPIFFSETGCNTVEPRTFTDQAAILGPDMDGTWSGAIIYEWIQVTNDYGLISYGPEVAATATQSGVVAGFTVIGTPTPISPDFDNLSSQWATLTPTGVSLSAYSATNTPETLSCPAYTSGLWEVSGNVPLPTIGNKEVSTATSGMTATSTGTKTGTSTATGTGSSASSGTATAASSSSGSSSAVSPAVRGGIVATGMGFIFALLSAI